MTSVRDPYPFPRLQDDDDFVGSRSAQKEPYGEPTHIAQKQDPWNRLNMTPTLTSSRREIYHHDPLAPRDSLDFILKSQYDHHKEFLKDNPETLVQPETLELEHGRTLKNRTFQVLPKENPLNHPLRQCAAPKKESVHSIKKAIDGHHTQTTNRGYSRKPDGGFFTS